MEKKKTALITGINGFIGKNLAGYLHDNGYRVTGLPRNFLNDPSELEKYLIKVAPTHIFHLAAYGNHSHQRSISETVTANYLKTFFLLEACRKLGIPNFINFSSSSVYGDKYEAMSEDDTLDTTSYYGATKAGAEYLCNAYAENEGINAVNIRPFSVYGEGEAIFRFIPTVIDGVINQKEITLYPKPVHDWIYIEDFLKGVLLIADNTKSLRGEAINIGTGDQYTNKEVYDLIIKIMGKQPLETIERKSERKYDNSRLWKANNAKLKALGWEPEFTLESGLRKTINYYRSLLNVAQVSFDDLDKVIDQTIKWAGGEWKDLT